MRLHTDMRGVAKRIRKSTCKFTKVAKSREFQAYTVGLWSAFVDLRWEKLVYGFELDQSQCKSAEVGDQTKHKLNASQNLQKLNLHV